MGMFDSFWGEYKCTACGNIVKFEEQTKDYQRALEDFYLGDYVDRGNRNYFYEFVSYCPRCHADHEISLAIRRGQYVGIYYKYEADEINIMDLENIEDGYERNRMYDRMCSEKIGCVPVETDEELTIRRKGDYIDVLRTRWKIEEVYIEKPKKSLNPLIKKMFRAERFVYRVTDGTDRRIIVEYEPNILHVKHIRVCEDDFEQKSKWTDEERERRFILQKDYKLVRLE